MEAAGNGRISVGSSSMREALGLDIGMRRRKRHKFLSARTTGHLINIGNVALLICAGTTTRELRLENYDSGINSNEAQNMSKAWQGKNGKISLNEGIA
jgi:hypothetical protein